MTIGAPSGNSVAFTLKTSVVVASFSADYIWTGTGSAGAPIGQKYTIVAAEVLVQLCPNTAPSPG